MRKFQRRCGGVLLGVILVTIGSALWIADSRYIERHGSYMRFVGNNKDARVYVTLVRGEREVHTLRDSTHGGVRVITRRSGGTLTSVSYQRFEDSESSVGSPVATSPFVVKLFDQKK